MTARNLPPESSPRPLPPGPRGFTLVELLVAMVLGLVIMGGVVNVFLTHQQTMRINQNLARVHENARFAVDTLLREIRMVGQIPCGSTVGANLIRVSGAVPWWASTYSGMVQGFDGGINATAIKAFGASAGDRVLSTDAVLILRASTDEADLRRLASHDPTGKTFTDGSSITTVVRDRDYSRPAGVCDGQSATVFQVDSASVSTGEYSYSSGTGSLNCSTNLGLADAACTATARTFPAGSMLTVWDPGFWYVGNNSRGGRSLYRQGIRINKTTGAVEAEALEQVPDVQDMQIDYLTRNRDTGNTLATDWVSASDAAFSAGWTSTTAEVVAVRIRLTVLSPDSVGEDGAPLTRTFVAVGAIRNREQ